MIQSGRVQIILGWWIHFFFHPEFVGMTQRILTRHKQFSLNSANFSYLIKALTYTKLIGKMRATSRQTCGNCKIIERYCYMCSPSGGPQITNHTETVDKCRKTLSNLSNIWTLNSNLLHFKSRYPKLFLYQLTWLS